VIGELVPTAPAEVSAKSERSELSARVALGVDIGLSGTRAALVSEDGTVLSRGAAARPVNPAAGLSGQSPVAIWRQEAVDAVRQAFSGVARVEVAAIGVGGLGPSTVLVDSELEVVAGPILFTDGASDEALPGPAAGTVSTDNAIPKLLKLYQQEPALVTSAAFALDTTGWLVAWLTGIPVMDALTAVDYRLDGAESPVPLPPAAAPDAIAGLLRPVAAEALGIASATPVAVGTYDSYVDIFAMGVSSPRDGALLLGSSLVAAALVEAAGPVENLGLRALEWPFSAGSLVGGWTSSAGAAIDWADRVFVADGGEAGSWKPPTRLSPGSGGVLFLPYLSGERTPAWDPEASGVITGLRLETTPPELRRSVLDGVALSARDVIERIADAGGRPGRWRVGGGGTRHPEWLQATADATGETLEVLDASGGVGAAVVGFRSIGVDVDLPATGTVGPDRAAAERFDRLSVIYGTLYPALAEAMHALQEFRTENL
jgi:xylulokinase